MCINLTLKPHVSQRGLMQTGQHISCCSEVHRLVSSAIQLAMCTKHQHKLTMKVDKWCKLTSLLLVSGWERHLWHSHWPDGTSSSSNGGSLQSTPTNRLHRHHHCQCNGQTLSLLSKTDKPVAVLLFGVPVQLVLQFYTKCAKFTS